MSKELLVKYPLKSHYPAAYEATSGWKETENRSIFHNGRNYNLITVEKRNRTVAKICLAVLVTILSCGLVFALACGRQKVTAWWSGIDKARFSIQAKVPTSPTSSESLGGSEDSDDEEVKSRGASDSLALSDDEELVIPFRTFRNLPFPETLVVHKTIPFDEETIPFDEELKMEGVDHIPLPTGFFRNLPFPETLAVHKTIPFDEATIPFDEELKIEGADHIPLPTINSSSSAEEINASETESSNIDFEDIFPRLSDQQKILR